MGRPRKPPEEKALTTEEMRDDFLARLHEERNELKGVALVQALKALDSLVTKEREQPEEVKVDERIGLLDRLDAIPREHAKKLLEQEVLRLQGSLAAHQQALEDITKEK